MRHSGRPRVGLALAVLLTACAWTCGPAPARATTTYMAPVGDSITDGSAVPGAYRTDLWTLMTGGGHTIGYLGSLSNGPASLPDKDHEGHSGFRIDEIAAGINGWMGGYPDTPDDVLLMIGTNDMIQDYNVATAPTRLGSLIDQIDTAVPGVRIWVASIPPMTDATRNARAVAYNSQIPGQVSTRAGAGMNVYFVDIYSAVSTSDLYDGVHPDAGGHTKIAQAWYGAGVGTPEPASLTLLAIGGMALLARRRPRRRGEH